MPVLGTFSFYSFFILNALEQFPLGITKAFLILTLVYRARSHLLVTTEADGNVLSLAGVLLEWTNIGLIVG